MGDMTNKVTDDTQLILLPPPKRMERKKGYLLLGMETMIVQDPSCPWETGIYAQMLKDDITVWTGLNLGVTRGTARRGDILLQIDSGLGGNRYQLTVEPSGVCLSGGSLQALGWAVQTLRQIVRQKSGRLPCVSMDDSPRLEYRGFLHDVTRGRIQTLENLKGLVDKMVYYKQNQLQLNVEHTYLFRNMPELWRSQTPLTADEIMELDDYCYKRGVELVPAMATLGHLYELLRTKSYEEFCEMPDGGLRQFSLHDRMLHHTVNVSHPNALDLIKGMIAEYGALFRSDQFNLCADESFDLGKGRSRKLADEKGADNLYVDFVTNLMAFLIERGKKPMFWGDIICESPELYHRFPREAVCLNWGYLPRQKDDKIRALYEAGAVQYVCPGVRGWDYWVNDLKGSYENIRRMSDYAEKYNAIGILNTDWGDHGHINHPAFSIPGMIYGAVFSWNENVPEYDELNRQISLLEYGDASGKIADLLGRISDQMCFSWKHAVILKEWTQQGMDPEKTREFFLQEDLGRAPECNACVDELVSQMYVIVSKMDTSSRRIACHTLAALDMIRVWNKIGYYFYNLLKNKDGKNVPGEGQVLASELETCLHHYQELWRSESKEGGLGDITDVFCWYADKLRDTD